MEVRIEDKKKQQTLERVLNHLRIEAGAVTENRSPACEQSDHHEQVSTDEANFTED